MYDRIDCSARPVVPGVFARFGIASAIMLALILNLVCGCMAGCKSGVEPKERSQPVRVVVVELHGYVGCGVDAELLRLDLLPRLADRRDPIGLVVFVIDSQGGMLNRVGPLSDLLHAISQRVPTMGYVERAESAAALVALSIPMIGMPPEGVIGGVVGVEWDAVRRDWRSLPAEQQDAIRSMATDIAVRSGQDPVFAASMVAGVERSPSGSLVWTGLDAADRGYVGSHRSVEAMLDARWGEGGWSIDEPVRAAIRLRVSRAEEIRKEIEAKMRMLEIAIELAEDGRGEAVEVVEAAYDQLLDLGTRDGPEVMRAVIFTGLWGWMDTVRERVRVLEGISGDGGV